MTEEDEMTTPSLSWTPTYIRRSPRWYDGVARLMDLGCTFDLGLKAPEAGLDADALAEDILMARLDLEHARASISHP